MPDELTINGIAYVRKDALPKADVQIDCLHYQSVSELAKEFGIDRHHIYAAINAGELTYVLVNGCVRGKKVCREKFVS